MSDTLGMPAMTSSNASGRSGVGANQMGHVGQGILGTIEEGPGGMRAASFYYGSGSAFYQLPSVQRSHGDDVRPFNVTTFGSKGVVTVSRKWFHYGPTNFFFTYPIKYAWAGPEYHCRIFPKSMALQNVGAYGAISADDTWSAEAINTSIASNLIGEIATEVRSGPNILPTYFWSGGVGFAFLQLCEQNMGGGGQLTFDRYSNFALIMASTPMTSTRETLMRNAGGGLYYDHDTDYNQLPVKWGYVNRLTDEGTPFNVDVANPPVAAENLEAPGFIWAPVEWQITVPLKTPETNFWNALLHRKPLDSSCFASDLQYLITFANFFELSDTGLGLAHCPFYLPLDGAAKTPVQIAADVITGVSSWHPQINPVTATVSDHWLVASGLINFQSGAFVANTMWPQPIVGLQAATTVNTGPAAGFFYTNVPITDPNVTGSTRCRIGANPRIWANHYRVCNGFVYGGPGAPRPKMAWTGVTNADTQNRYMKDASTVTTAGTPSTISYLPGWTRAEWRNNSLKLTNSALSARLPLQQAPTTCVYYPFSYAFSQVYRVPASSNPVDANNFHRWCSNQIFSAGSASSNAVVLKDLFIDTTATNNKITQAIGMPANPVTSMIIGIYREKDRKFLGANTQGTYSPVLFWNALNPLKATLKDGGNILFDYTSSTAFQTYSLIDRPDVLKIPFRGGLCQLDPMNILPSPWDSTLNPFSKPNAYGRYRQFRSDYDGAGAAGPGIREAPLHCTEWYDCTLLEFPFVMYEPLSREGSVQSTPSFAKTFLTLEFYIDPLLKPQRGLDDMYDITTTQPTYWAGSGTQANSWAPLNFAAASAATYQNASNTVPNAYILDSVSTVNSYADDREASGYYNSNATPSIAGTRTATLASAGATMAANASSWNVNDGGLMIHVTFCQNQVWLISPIRTSILSARG